MIARLAGDPVASGAAVVLVAAVGLTIGRSDVGGRRGRGRLADAAISTGRRWSAPAPVVRALHRSGVAVDADDAFWTWMLAVAAAVAAAPAVPAGPLLALAVLVGPPVALGATRHRRDVLRRRQLPIVLDAVASALRSGRSVRGAIAEAAETAGPLSSELAAIASRAGAGRRLADELASWAEGDEADVRLAGAALATAATLGGPGAAALETTAQSLRDRGDANAAVDALSVQARLSALVLVLAPIGFAVLMTGIDPEASRFLLGTRAGWLCLIIGVSLDVAGGVWMSRIVRRAR